MLILTDRRQFIIIFSSITAAVSCIIGLQYGHILAHLEVRSCIEFTEPCMPVKFFFIVFYILLILQFKRLTQW
jgi:aquaporin PIP/heparan-alpha-glucosaminide N-acetyltransferase